MSSKESRRPKKQKARGTLMRPTLILHPEVEVFNILTAFAGKFMGEETNAANAAQALLEVALCDYERSMAKCGAIERYCKAESIDQAIYRNSLIRAKFPRGKLPKVRVG